jgi:ketosteroid isomerase-like protein
VTQPDATVGAASALDPVEQERAAVADGNAEAYLDVLAEDAVFLPPNSPSKSGPELRAWLTAFVRGWRVEWLRFETTGVEVVGDLAYHTYEFTWRVVPRAGGNGSVSSGKGLHVLRRQSGGPWRVAREIWNSSPG